MFKYAPHGRTKAVTSLAAVNCNGAGLHPKGAEVVRFGVFSELAGVDKVDSVPADLTVSRYSRVPSSSRISDIPVLVFRSGFRGIRKGGHAGVVKMMDADNSSQGPQLFLPKITLPCFQVWRVPVPLRQCQQAET